MNLSIDIARRILEASKQRAKELRSPVSIAIVDAGGHLVLFERMMSPYGWATGNISIAKANTAVMFNQPTDSVAQWGSGIPGFASSMAEMTQGKFIMAAGGWPIRMNGATVGGIGVSGGNAPGRDDEIARAGLAALEAMAPAIPAQPPQSPQPLQSQQPPQYSQPLQPQLQQQQHSRPYMQPTPSYPSLPLANSGMSGGLSSQPQSQSQQSQPNALVSPPPQQPQESSSSSGVSSSMASPGLPQNASNSANSQQNQENIAQGTQPLIPDQSSEEENPYGDQTFIPFNDSRSGGQQ